MTRTVHAALLLLVAACSVRAAEVRELRGRVTGDNGQPVAGVDVSPYWDSNGSFWKDGKPIKLDSEAAQQEHWGPRHLGEMAPGIPEAVKTDAEGRFSIRTNDYYHTLIAMDQARSRGGLGIVSKADPAAPIEIRLGPLVRVRGSFEGPAKGVRPSWTFLYMNSPDDPTRPLDVTRIAGCGSNEARFQMTLPVGRYFIHAYDNDMRAQLYGKEIVLSAETPDTDLGAILLPPSRSVIAQRKQSQDQGTFGDYRKHYGQKPPAWHVSHARGVSKDVQISDFKGKWVVLEFWGLGCRPCLGRTIPELMKFYEEHAGQRDRFEILSFCLDPEGDLESLEDMDKALRPIVEHVWGGKTIPFPILLDNTFKTWESFGLQGVGTTLLIDPQGNLVEGDLDLLKKRLQQ